MPTVPPALHIVALVLCRYSEQGQGTTYRERDCTYWFSSLERCNAWIQSDPFHGNFYAYPLRGLSAQLAHLKLFQKSGFVGVVCDAPPGGSGSIPIDELVSAIAARLEKDGAQAGQEPQ